MLKTKVAYVVNRFATGGVKSLLSTYWSHLDAERFELHLVASRHSGECERSGLSDLAARGVVVHEVSSVVRFARYYADCKRVFAREGPDVVHACMNALNPFALAAAKATHVPVRISYNLSAAHPGERKTLVKNALRPFGAYGATCCAANSGLAWDWLFGTTGIQEKTIIPNAVDFGRFVYSDARRAKARKRLGVSADSFVVGHIGRYEYQKNHEFLIDIFDEIYKMEERSVLVLVGYGSLKDGIMKKIDQLGLASAVLDLGGTENIDDLYSAFDCFLLPSFYEGLPIVGIEAQAASCPCIFSTEITKEAAFLETSSYLTLAASPREWAERALSFREYETRRNVSDSEEVIFDAPNAARELERLYAELLTQAKQPQEEAQR